MTDTTQELCQCDLHQNGIYELIYADSSREVVDAFIAKMAGIYEGKTKEDPTLRFLMNATHSGMLPVRYVFPKVRELLNTYPQRPNARTAFLLENTMYVAMLDVFMQMMRSQEDRIRYFRTSQREEAIAWLLADD